MPVSRSCSWCHTLNHEIDTRCRKCGHSARVARIFCDCPSCTVQRQQWKRYEAMQAKKRREE